MVAASRTLQRNETSRLLRYDAILLDIDGTLVDSNAAHAAAWSEAFAANGQHHPPAQIRPLIGKGGDKLLWEQALLKDATTADDAERSKPDPDILLAALETSGSSRDRAIMIGDTPYDIEAASRAGLATIAFRCGGWDDAALDGSIAIYDDPRQLLDRLAESPLYAETS